MNIFYLNLNISAVVERKAVSGLLTIIKIHVLLFISQQQAYKKKTEKKNRSYRPLYFKPFEAIL